MNGHQEGPEPERTDRERERTEADPSRRPREARHEFYPGEHGSHDGGHGRVYGQTHAAHGYYAHRDFDPRSYERRGFERAAPGQYERDPNSAGPIDRRPSDLRYESQRYESQRHETPEHWNAPYRSSHEHPDPRSRFAADRPNRPFGQQLFNREPSEEPHYFGTGSQGAGGGPSFTGGAYGVADERSDSPHFREIGFNQGYYGDSPGGRPLAHGEELYGGRNAGIGHGQPRRRYRMGPKGYQRSDERLREDISERLMQTYHIDSSEVTVQVQGGKVILEGTVPDRYMKHAIEDIADAAPGVQDIENRIRVASPWAGRDQTQGSHDTLEETRDKLGGSAAASALVPPNTTSTGSPGSSVAATAASGKSAKRD